MILDHGCGESLKHHNDEPVWFAGVKQIVLRAMSKEILDADLNIYEIEVRLHQRRVVRAWRRETTQPRWAKRVMERDTVEATAPSIVRGRL